MGAFFRNKNLLGATLALGVLAVYLTTLSSSVQPEDCGEIAAALYSLGIVHPTGYPLFTLLGWAFSHLPLGGTPIWRLNLLVALLVSLSVFFFFRLFLFLLGEGSRIAAGKAPAASPTNEKGRPLSAFGADSGADRLAAAVAVLVLAFSRTLWSEGLSLEVYALHALFLSVVTLLFLRALSEHARRPGAIAGRWWIAFAFVLGLSFTNHMMTVLLAPAFLCLYFAVNGFGRSAWIRIGKAVVPFLLGLSPYLYLPLRAARAPLMNWGDPSSPDRLWWHLSARQYHYAMYASIEVAERKTAQFFAALPAEFGYVPLLFALLGLWVLFRRHRGMFVFSLLLFLGCLCYSVNYDFDDPNFYVNAYVATAIWVLYGVRALLGRAAERNWRRRAWALCGLLALVPPVLNYRAVDASRDFAVEDYVKNALGTLEPNAILLTNETRSLTLPAYYYQIVEKYRPDVVLLDYRLLGFAWYYAELEQRYPDVIRNSRPEIDGFLREARIFEETDSKDATVLALRFVQAVHSILWKNAATRPVYVTRDIQADFTRDFQVLPSGLAFRVFRDSGDVAPVPFADFPYRPFTRDNVDVEDIRTYYAAGYVNQGIRWALEHDTAQGEEIIRRALEVKPGFAPALEWLRRLGAP